LTNPSNFGILKIIGDNTRSKKMKALLNFFGFAKTETKKAHSYKKAYTTNGVYAKREDGLEYFISSDLLN